MRILAALLMSAFVPNAALAAESAYTTVAFEADCKAVQEDELGGSWTCKGYGAYPIHFSEGDLRQSAFYGPVGAWYEQGASETFGRFNHAGPTVEWRLDKGTPYATIRRWFIAGEIDNEGENGPETQVLVVSKVAQPGDGDGCIVGYVEASGQPGANEQARQVADTMAKSFACRQDEPKWHGPRTANVEPQRHFEAGE